MVAKKKYVLVILDGAADRFRDNNGLSPLALADMPYTNKICSLGCTGRMQTLFPDLPRESLVAQLGMLGWDPYRYYPLGRASAELLATYGIQLEEKDLAFRANFITLGDTTLKSYNADYIRSEASIPLVDKINTTLGGDFSDIQLYHNSDFRNTLVIKNAAVDPMHLTCIEPHESENKCIHIRELVTGKEEKSWALAHRLNAYLFRVHALLRVGKANAIVPWSVSRSFHLPSFNDHTGFKGKAGIIGAMDFLHGMAIAGGIDFFKVGDGSPQTDYKGKGDVLVALLRQDYDLVICHINAPDEASHMQSLSLKVSSLSDIDRHIVKPVYEYFAAMPAALGGVMIVPDHYTNLNIGHMAEGRKASHSTEPVPFLLWNDAPPDAVQVFTEDSVSEGRYNDPPVPSLSLIKLLCYADL